MYKHILPAEFGEACKANFLQYIHCKHLLLKCLCSVGQSLNTVPLSTFKQFTGV